MKKNFYSLGLMSGTSMDGIDASIIYSNGVDNLKIIENNYYKYVKLFVLIDFFPINSWAKAEQSRGTKYFQKLKTNGKIIGKYGYSEM